SALDVRETDLLWQLHPLDPFGPALVLLARAISVRLTKGVEVRMVRVPRREGAGRAARSKDDGAKDIALVHVPDDLLSGIWLEFAQAVHRDARYRRCGHCKTWFEMGKDKRHKDRQYCSDYCKVKSYRTRKTQARKLAVRGLKPEAIADATGADLKSVKAWT